MNNKVYYKNTLLDKEVSGDHIELCVGTTDFYGQVDMFIEVDNKIVVIDPKEAEKIFNAVEAIMRVVKTDGHFDVRRESD